MIGENGLKRVRNTSFRVKELESDPALTHASGRTPRHFGNVEQALSEFEADGQMMDVVGKDGKKTWPDSNRPILPIIERSLRVMTMQGPRVTIARSDCMPAGTTLEFTVQMLKNRGYTEEILHKLFNYGRYEGIGQWRSGGNGRFIIKQFKKVK
ncbi:MAG: hypothetical protein HQ446_09055 [Polaromonas sp.]|nr:hypothetical protein [Polaromonas sp.]